MTNKTILIVAGFQPYPTHFGGAFDVWEKLKALQSLGFTIDLIFTEKKCPTENELDEIKKHVRFVRFVPRKNKWWQLLSVKPLQIVSRKELRHIIIQNTYDFILLEGEFVGDILQNKTLRYQKIILRIHNDEVKFFNQLAQSTTSLFKKWYYQIEAKKIENYIKPLHQKADKLWYISNEECIKSRYSEKSVWLPVPILEEFRSFVPKKNKNVLFIGALFMPNNLFGLQWYLDFVHPHFIKFTDYSLTIVGGTKSKSEQDEIVQKFAPYTHVHWYFNQNDLTPFYADATAFINPIFHGSGVKIKSVLALVNGLPLVTTSVGAEGFEITKDMYWHAETSEEFVSQIKNIFNSDEITLKNKMNLAQKHINSLNIYSIIKKELNII